jgi:hypothetical protein
MISPTSVDWTSLNTLRATPGPEVMALPASLLDITRMANLKPAVVRPVMEILLRQGYVREYQTQFGKAYARTPQGNQRIREVKEWLR